VYAYELKPYMESTHINVVSSLLQNIALSAVKQNAQRAHAVDHLDAGDFAFARWSQRTANVHSCATDQLACKEQRMLKL